MAGSRSTNAGKKKPARAERAQGGRSFFTHYLEESRTPLTVLLFLLPLLIAYEVLVIVALRSGGTLVTPDAHRWILTLFEAFDLGTFGLWLPGVLVVVILLSWHTIERRPWRSDSTTVGLMWSESLVLALPLLVFSQAALRIPAMAAAAPDFHQLPLGAKLAVSVGAGIYEELLFRLGLIGLLGVVFEDLMKLGRTRSLVFAIGLSAIAFMLYHPLRDGSGAVHPARVVFYLGAGVYFGVVFAMRGFGIAVGAHAFYDVLAVLFAASAAAAGTE